MNRTTTYITALAIALVLSASTLLDGPNDIEVMQMVADEAQVRVVLP